ncbi:MAG: pyrimidine-nucleoside phosphorylase [Eubacteriales bacterium]|nr:pyrimidine-nucleoside phosphorylase [Eubacteriales bacterium]
MRMVDIIEKKAGCEPLSSEEIQFFIDGFVSGDIPDYQASALLMAIVLNDMNEREAADLTLHMMHSGDTVDLSDLPGVKVDKHSSGGVGDTTTLVVAPLVAACGGTVAKMSGRGLAFSGGTIDKLESIPGVNISQTIERFKQIVRKTGVCVIGQTGNLVPADKKMYALRDVTGTVQSVPLIAASIMSKKLAAGADAIVLDVKVGSGAFMKTVEDAKRLAELMVKMGKLLKREVVAVVTDMNQPLGLSVGNALEFREAVQLLAGQIPENDPLYEICLLLGTQMLLLSKLAKTDDEARGMLKHAIENGSGLEKLRSMIHELGGDASLVTLKGMDQLCTTRRQIPVPAKNSGYIVDMQAELIGRAAQVLGAGRATKEDVIDPAVGLVMHKRVGDRVEQGDAICTLYVNDESNLADAMETMTEAVRIGEKPKFVTPMVYAVIR